MNTKSFAIGFAAMDSIIAGVSATKRGIVHGAQVSAQAIKTGALNVADSATSFFAGAKHAVECRRGSCRMLTHDVRSNEE